MAHGINLLAPSPEKAAASRTLSSRLTAAPSSSFLDRRSSANTSQERQAACRRQACQRATARRSLPPRSRQTACRSRQELHQGVWLVACSEGLCVLQLMIEIT